MNKLEKGEKVYVRGIRRKDLEESPTDENKKKNLIDLSLKLMVESEINKMIAERILYELSKETYNDSKLYKEKITEILWDNKKVKVETSRIKKVNLKNSKKSQ